MGGELNIFDAELFRHLLTAAAAQMQHDEALIQFNPQAPHPFTPDLIQEEMPDLVVWRRDRIPVLLGAAEHWYRIGGPEPYHDSYTLSLFGTDKTVKDLARTLQDAGRELIGAAPPFYDIA